MKHFKIFEKKLSDSPVKKMTLSYKSQRTVYTFIAINDGTGYSFEGSSESSTVPPVIYQIRNYRDMSDSDKKDAKSKLQALIVSAKGDPKKLVTILNKAKLLKGKFSL